jgi:nanoRNase/pAp phosphatase (c-di-AMP/oligoRNAs hydrolase)
VNPTDLGSPSPSGSFKVTLPPVDVAQQLANLAGRGQAVVLMHDNPDPDCMAAAECLRALLKIRAGLEVTVARGGMIGRPENRAMVQVLGLRHVPVEDLDLESYGVIALVDTQPETGNNSLPIGHRVDIVVDHHPLRGPAVRAPWCDIRDTYGASSTITYDYLRSSGIPIDPTLATALLYAIKSETRDLGREASPHEMLAYQELLPRADMAQLHAIAEPKVPAAHFAALDRALRRAELRDFLLTVSLGELDYPDLVAELADLLLPYERASWVMCTGRYKGHCYLSLRTDQPHAHAGGVIRRLVAGKGAAGGHGMIAGGRMHGPIPDDASLAVQHADLVLGLCRELAIPPAAPPVPLI